MATFDELGLERVSASVLSTAGAARPWRAFDALELPERLALRCTRAPSAPPGQWPARAASVRVDGVGAVAEAARGRSLTETFPAACPANLPPGLA